jgi:hypothetical protein
VEKNRSGLQELLRQLTQHPELRTDPHVAEFLCLAPADPGSAAPRPPCHARAGAFAKPATRRHSSDDDDDDDQDAADTVDAMRAPEVAVRNGGRWSEAPGPPRAAGPGQACSEPRGTVWIGAGEFPAP